MRGRAELLDDLVEWSFEDKGRWQRLEVVACVCVAPNGRRRRWRRRCRERHGWNRLEQILPKEPRSAEREQCGQNEVDRKALHEEMVTRIFARRNRLLFAPRDGKALCCGLGCYAAFRAAIGGSAKVIPAMRTEAGFAAAEKSDQPDDG